MAKKELLDLWSLETQEIDGDLSHYTMTITGNGGVGKSSFANALFSRLAPTAVFGCEDRFKGIKNIKLVPIDSWDTITKYKTAIKKGLKETGKLPFTNIIIDPVGQLGKMVEDYIKEENGVSDIGDIPYGGGYTLFEEEFSGTIKEIRSLGVNVSFVSHGKNEQISPPRQDPYDVQMPDIQKRLKYMVKDEVDFLLYLATVRENDSEGNPRFKRRLYLQGYPEFSLKVPLDGFPEYIEWDDNVEEGVDKFLEAFNHAVEVTRSGNKEDKPVTNKKSKQPISIPKELPADNSDDDGEIKDAKNDLALNDLTLEELVDKAVEVRDKMLETKAKTEVISILKEYLGTAKISDVDDTGKLMEFIGDNQ